MPELSEIELDLFAADLERDGDEMDGEEAETAWLDAGSDEYALPFDLPALGVTPRPYQKDALTAWGRASGRRRRGQNRGRADGHGSDAGGDAGGRADD